MLIRLQCVSCTLWMMAFRHVRYNEMIHSWHSWSLKQHFKPPEYALIFFPLTNPYWWMRRSRLHTITPAEEGCFQNHPEHNSTSNGQTQFFPHIRPLGWGLSLAGCNLTKNRMSCANTRSFQIKTNSQQYLHKSCQPRSLREWWSFQPYKHCQHMFTKV